MADQPTLTLTAPPAKERAEKERLGAFHLYNYELPLLTRIRQARNDAAAGVQQFLIQVEGDKVYIIEIAKEKRVALA